MRRCPLDPFFAPATIAVVGATEADPSVGRTILENLSSFQGRIYPVNPKHDRVLGLPAYPSVGAAPPPVDLAIVATPARTVPAIVAECAAAHIPAAIVISAGFKEA